jgi:hypothetical protein
MGNRGRHRLEWLDRVGILALLAGLAAGEATPVSAVQLALSSLGTAVQSSDLSATYTAAKAIDGQTASYSATQNAADSFWEVELARSYRMSRVEIVAPSAGSLSGVVGGLTLRIFDLRDRTRFTTNVVNPGLGGTWSVDLPKGVDGRIVRLALENGSLNDAGSLQVALAEVRVFGDPSPAFGPCVPSSAVTVSQSSDGGTAYASLAADGSPDTYSMTADVADSFWLLARDHAGPIRRVELVNRRDALSSRLSGLVVRILDDQSNAVASATASDPGLGAVWGFNAPAGTTGRYVRIGLEGGALNGAGDHVVQLAEVSVLSATNVALGKDSYMVRYLDSLPPAGNANDGNYASESLTTAQSVDAYWEVDLGQLHALYGVRTVAANGFTDKDAHCTVRLFDEAHESVFSQHLSGASPTFDVDALGPVNARYVRVGLENKERTAGGIEWYLGFKEVEAFGRPAADVGLLDMGASTTRIASGQSAVLTWRVEDLHRLDLHPAIGSVGAFTGIDGAGALMVSPTSSVEYLLVGTNRSGSQTRALTVEVDGQALPVRISEFVAENGVSLEDGQNDAPDWIELHNPNNAAMDLAGMGLSDDPAAPMKWVFPPAVSIPAHGHLIVFASGRANPFDAKGYLHADFQLDAGGESILVTATDGVTVADAVLGFPAQREDLAYGRTVEGSWTFLDPTPGAPNLALAYAGWLKPIDYSRTRSFCTNAFLLSISNANAGAAVYYSVNGTEPSTPYSSPLSVSSSVCVRAAVRRAGYKSPPVKTHTYIFTAQILSAAYMNQGIVQDIRYSNRARLGLTGIPSISVAVPQLPDDYIERPASVEVFWPDGSPPVQENCGFLRFGGAWTTFAKKNYRLKFRQEYGARKLEAPLFRGFDHGILAEEAFDEIDLGAGHHDMAERGFYMSARFTEDTMLDMGSLNPHGRFVNLYINGTYWGQYHARERLTDSFLADYLGGEKADYLNVRGNDNAGNSFIPGVPDPPNRFSWDRVRSLRNSYASVKPYLGAQDLIDFMLMWNYGNAETEYRSAGTVGAGSGFKFWIGDADGYLRTSAMNLDFTWSTGPGDLFGGLVAERNPDFMTLVADRIQKHFFLDGALTPERNLARLNDRMNEITNSLVGECARWGYRTPDNWESAAQTVRTGLFPGRTANLFTYLRNRGLYPRVDPPVFSQYGGSVTTGTEVVLSSASGTIYYTLDGSDPRLPGGGVAPGALWSGSPATNAIAAGSGWRHWNQGSLPAANWADPAYDDTAWPYGNAQLGYGEGDEATVISYGGNANNKRPAYYFRSRFVLQNPGAVSQLAARLLRDDGAVVYLNGVEQFRDNMPAGDIAYSTWASAPVGGSDETTFFNHALSTNGLVAGTNVVAVEIHQSSATSGDVSFDFALQMSVDVPPASIAVESNTLFRARVLDGTNWSALVEASFVVAPRVPLGVGHALITEVHYNPDGPDDYQFLELFNPGSNVVVMTGARLQGGVDFLFPDGFSISPGAFAVVVENASAFLSRYQTTNSPWYYPGIKVAGAWAGRLAEGGERIALATTSGVEVCALTYSSGSLWPERADGKGSSLELRDPAAVPTNLVAREAYLSQGSRWRSSSLYHGSPGRFDHVAPLVVINEVLPHTDEDEDWVELHNPGATPADLSGVCLSDHYENPTRFTFPEEVDVPAGGYLVLSSDELGFGFSELGSDILLTQVKGTNIVRFIDTVDVPAGAREETFGRHVRSDGQSDFTELRSPTQGSSNALPRIGPVVFSEIMYRPAAGKSEYVALVNMSGGPMPLYDPLRPSNTWSLADAVEFTFPPDQQLAPCAHVIVCGTNPAAFRAEYGVSSDQPVYGPWSGALDNDGESVRLQRPGDPEPDGFVPQYRVDRVFFEPLAPWPASAVSGGRALQRLTLEAYGNDPANWEASAPGSMPGSAAGNRPPTIGVIGESAVNEGDTVIFSVYVADADEPWQQVSLTHGDMPPGGSFNPADNSFTWVTGEADGPGVHLAKFVATDSAPCPASLTQAVAVTVAEVNVPHTIALPQGMRYPAETPLKVQIQASDTDWPPQSLMFYTFGLPAGLEVDPFTGWIEGSALVPGLYVVYAFVSDDQDPTTWVNAVCTLSIEPPFALAAPAGPASAPPRFLFNALTNESYEVDYSETLEPPEWHFLRRIDEAPAGVLEFADPDADPTQRFYRIRWLQQ